MTNAIKPGRSTRTKDADIYLCIFWCWKFKAVKRSKQRWHLSSCNIIYILFKVQNKQCGGEHVHFFIISWLLFNNKTFLSTLCLKRDSTREKLERKKVNQWYTCNDLTKSVLREGESKKFLITGQRVEEIL